MAVTMDNTADVELGVSETKDLDSQAAQIESLRKQIQTLQTDTCQRVANIETNLRGMKSKRDEVVQLRADYDKALNRGDASLAGQVLKKIKHSHESLVAIARQVKEADGDISDLKERAKELHKQACHLSIIARENFALAKQLSIDAARNCGTLSLSIGNDFIKFSKLHEDSLKVADQILSE